MKKPLILILMALVPLLASAQEISYPSYNHRVITNTFFSNWFASIGVDNSASYSSQEHGAADRFSKSPFSSDRSVVTMNLSLGKWLTHTFALRFKVNGFTSRCVGSALEGTDAHTYRQWTYELQPLINLHSLFAGYRQRIWDASLYAGMGIARNYGRSGSTEPHHSAWIGTLGLLNTFHVSRRVHVSVDISASVGEAGMDGQPHAVSTAFVKGRDCIVRFGIGVGVNLGRTGWKKAPDMGALMDMNQAEIDALNLTIQELESENARLRSASGSVDVECEIPEAPEP